MTERIMTQHPDASRKGTNIEKHKYDLVREAILSAVQDNGEIAFWDLVAAVEKRLSADFDGSVGWYTTTVKLDLEARDLIERVPGSSPQRLRLIE